MRIPSSNEINGVQTQRQNINSVQNPTQGAINALTKAGQIYNQYKKEQDHTDLVKAQTAYQEKYNTFRQEEFTKEGEDAKGIYKRYNNTHKQILDEVGQGLSEKAKAALQTWGDQKHSNDKVQFYSYEHKQNKNLAIDSLNKRSTSIEESVRLDPFSYVQAKNDLEESYVMGVGSGAVPKEELTSRLTDAKNKLRNYSMQERYNADPDKAIERIDEMEFGEGEKQKWLDKFKADQDRKTRQASARNREQIAILMEQVPGQEIVAKNHGEDGPGITELKATAQKLFDLGADREGRKIARKAELYETSSRALSKYEEMPLKDAIIKASGHLKVSENSKSAQKEEGVRNIVMSSLENRARKFQADPAGYFQNKVIGKTAEERVSWVLKKQEEQGIPLKAGPQALSKVEKIQYRNQFEGADTKGKVAFVHQISSEYGKHSNQVLKEAGVAPSVTMAKYFNEGLDQELLVTAATSKPQITNDIKMGEYIHAARSSEVMEVLNEVKGLMPQDARFGNAVKHMEKTIANISILKGETTAGGEMFDSALTTISNDKMKVFYPEEISSYDVELTLKNKRKGLTSEIAGDEMSYAQKQEVEKSLADSVWINGNGGFVLINPVTGKAYPKSFIGFDEVENMEETRKATVVPQIVSF